uniref:Uncharacterized protein n=1 Tax=Anopheles minimus TaxID=112268 RepID=A0A182VWM1_9DIPT
MQQQQLLQDSDDLLDSKDSKQQFGQWQCIEWSHDHRRSGHHERREHLLAEVSTPMSASYDSNSIAKATSNSAFTPINAMPPHLNSLQHHHQLATQRPSYLYDAISFQNQKAAMAQSPSNAFPNQLISLHQIRNYAHQPAGGLMAGEHLLGVTVGPGGKDKG